MTATTIPLRKYRVAYTKHGECETTASISTDSYDRVKRIIAQLARVSSVDDLEDWEIHDITEASDTGVVAVCSKANVQHKPFIHRFDFRKSLIGYKLAKLVKKDNQPHA